MTCHFRIEYIGKETILGKIQSYISMSFFTSYKMCTYCRLKFIKSMVIHKTIDCTATFSAVLKDLSKFKKTTKI